MSLRTDAKSLTDACVSSCTMNGATSTGLVFDGVRGKALWGTECIAVPPMGAMASNGQCTFNDGKQKYGKIKNLSRVLSFDRHVGIISLDTYRVD